MSQGSGWDQTHTVGWEGRPASLGQLCNSGQMIHLSEPQLPHLYRGGRWVGVSEGAPGHIQGIQCAVKQ